MINFSKSLNSRLSVHRSFRPSLACAVSLFFAMLAAAFCASGPVRAQDQNPPDQQPSSTEPQLHHVPPAPVQSVGKLSSSTKLVTVYAVVRDKHGKIVPTLTRDDFALEEDGRPQTISHFIVQTDVPLTLGLLVDTSMSQRAAIVPERDASYTFLDHLLTAKDVAFVIHFDRDIELLQDLTASRPKLQAALQQLNTPQLDRDDNSGNGGDNEGNGGGQRGRGMGGGTHLYDAIWLASSDVLKKQQGRKAIFVLSDGVDRGSKESITDAIEAAQLADTAVYTIYFAGEEPQNDGYQRHRRWGGGVGSGWPGGGGGWPGGGGGGNQYPREQRVDGKKILLQISEQTGGVMFEVSKNLPLNKIYDVAAEGLRNQYSIGYTPNPPDTDPGYHTIHLTAQKKDLIVQARQGYYSAP